MATPEDIDYVRLLIADQGMPPLLEDYQLGLLIDQGGSTLYGAADALDAIATSEVLLAKKITSQDLTTDGPAVAAALRQQATALRARADKAVSRVAEEAWGFTAFRPGHPGTPELAERLSGW